MLKQLIYSLLFVYTCFSCTNKPKKESIAIDKKKKKNNIENIIQMHSEKLFSNKVEIFLTSDFVNMSKEEVITIYPNPKRRPDIIYKNSEGTVNISLQHTNKRTQISELPKILEQLTDQYKSDPTIQFINSRIENINGKNYAVLEFISQGNNNKVYNLMFVTSLEDKVMMCAFTCAMPVIKKWKEIGIKIMKSIRII